MKLEIRNEIRKAFQLVNQEFENCPVTNIRELDFDNGIDSIDNIIEELLVILPDTEDSARLVGQINGILMAIKAIQKWVESQEGKN